MTNNHLTPEGVDEVLAAVHEELESGADASRIGAIADGNPGARDQILAFAAEWSASAGSDLQDELLDPGHTARQHAALLERYHRSTSAEASPARASAWKRQRSTSSRTSPAAAVSAWICCESSPAAASTSSRSLES